MGSERVAPTTNCLAEPRARCSGWIATLTRTTAVTESRTDDARALRAVQHPDHHLWRNGRTWWIAFTFHFGERAYRVRRSLSTTDVAEARARRDELLARYARQPGWQLALRFPRTTAIVAEGAA